MARPWALPDPDEYTGSEEIVSPGGPVHIGLIGISAIDNLRIATALRPLCESPIEVELGTWLVRLLAIRDVVAVPQYRWQRWRMDFALKRGTQLLMFIECDGREFHETAKQIENDRRKDAAAAQAGIPLIRFSGADIYSDARHCAELAITRLYP